MKKHKDNIFKTDSACSNAKASDVEAALKAIASGEATVKHIGSFSLTPVEGNPIYVVTAIQWDDLGSRRWGWFPTKEQAFTAIERNDGDLYEAGYYPFIVVEELPPGIMPCAFNDKRWWFVWEDKGYKPSPCPTKYEDVIGFGMG